MQSTVIEQKKGINFKQTPVKKLLLIHPETFMAYCDSLPKNDAGWVVFDIQLVPKLTPTSQFAIIRPERSKKAS